MAKTNWKAVSWWSTTEIWLEFNFTVLSGPARFCQVALSEEALSFDVLYLKFQELETTSKSCMDHFVV